MVYKFRLLSDEVNNFKREITIDASATFQDLKNAICDSTGYDKNQLCSFFICDDNWEKEKEITLEDMGADSSEDFWLMEDTVLEDMIEDEGQKLLFVFDYLTERAFFMEMAEYVPGRNLKTPYARFRWASLLCRFLTWTSMNSMPRPMQRPLQTQLPCRSTISTMTRLLPMTSTTSKTSTAQASTK